jgi:hypothetical protein
VLEDWVFLALVQHRQGKSQEAGDSLKKARQALAEGKAAVGPGEAAGPLRDLEATLLLEEAAGVVEKME